MVAICALGWALVTPLAQPAIPGEQQALTREELQLIRQLERHLNGIGTMVADFIQVSPYGTSGVGGSISFGRVFLERPGKIRWEYDAPTPLLIVINDDDLTYYDLELDQISYSSVDSRLSELLIDENIRFLDEGIRVVDVRANEDAASITLQESAAESTDNLGIQELSLLFATAPELVLKRIKLRDMNGKVTTVELKNPRYGEKLEDALFVVKNPRIFNRKKRP